MAFKMMLESLEGLAPEVAQEYTEKDGKFHIQVEGMKTQADIDRVTTSLTAARTEAAGFKAKLALLGDRKVEDIIPMLDRIPVLEAAAAGKLDEDKLKEMAELRARAIVAPIERERDGFKQQVGVLTGEIETFKTRESTRTIHDQIQQAAKKAGVIDEAMEDAINAGERLFVLEEGTGKAVVKEGVSVTQGLEPKDWLSDLQTKKPHWFGQSGGGGANGNRGGGGGAEVNPFSHDGWNITKQGQMMQTDIARADRLAKAAGHKDAESAMTKPAKK
ncbi:hypothetical protein [Sphingobium sp.]|uniref:hypothetical protein n=1 Tax=Sphingobium sp. TaxID=1912891 RepID=UPI000C612913|nr:hypothetical protein [Sphingobium sp.]MBS90866.1 hypothetical protein [Sphingobium sp.]